MKKQSGSVLVLTAITIAVLMVAGVSFVSHTTVEYKANVNSTRTVQAFYLAEGGLAWGMEKLDNFIADQITAGSTNVRLPNPGELAALFDLGSLSSSGIAGTALDLTVDPSNHMKGILTATALHNGASNSVSQEIELYVTYAAAVPSMGIVMAGFPNAILANGDVTVSSGNITVTGTTVISTGTTKGSHAHTVSYTSDTSGEFQKILATIPNQQVLKRDRPVGAIPLPANGILNTGTDPNVEVAYFGTSLSGDISLTGVGKAKIYITGSIEIKGQDINSSGDSSRLTIYVDGSSIQVRNPGTRVNANIWTPNANISFTNNSEYVGSVVSGGSNIEIHSNNTSFGFLLAPFAHVELKANAAISGGIVSDTVHLQSGATINHNPSADSGYYVSTILGSESSGTDSADLVRRGWTNR